jgi:hypothetical protein
MPITRMSMTARGGGHVAIEDRALQYDGAGCRRRGVQLIHIRRICPRRGDRLIRRRWIELLRGQLEWRCCLSSGWDYRQQGERRNGASETDNGIKHKHHHILLLGGDMMRPLLAYGKRLRSIARIGFARSRNGAPSYRACRLQKSDANVLPLAAALPGARCRVWPLFCAGYCSLEIRIHYRRRYCGKPKQQWTVAK